MPTYCSSGDAITGVRPGVRLPKSWLMTFEELLASNAALSGEVQRSQEALKT